MYFKNFVLPIVLNALFCNCMILGEGAIERKVLALHRSKIGNISVKNLKLGEWRYLTAKEVERLLP